MPLGYFFGVAGERLIKRIRGLLFESILQQEVAWFDSREHQPGYLTALLATEATKVSKFTGTRLSSVLEAILIIAISLAVALYYNWQVTLVMLSFFPMLALGNALQDKVKCFAEIIQELGGISHRVLKLTGCSPIIEPMAERLLKPSEYETTSFKRALRKAWELFHQIMRRSGQLFNIVDVKDGTIERDTEQKIKYTAIFEETICTRGIDEYRYEGVYASDCSRKTPHVLRNCGVKVTTNEEGEHVAVSCTSY
ncbi:ABC transporter B member 11 [Clonorchis sinensis]|uniref:ABC transporter B member 11 n=1 Tax=Clonorchis sinensis TaxID=79923 RepID=A0A8T1MSY8_CLOSI|nr:ABC transporter B member 11 [Clonorchis sinensis]